MGRHAGFNGSVDSREREREVLLGIDEYAPSRTAVLFGLDRGRRKVLPRWFAEGYTRSPNMAVPIPTLRARSCRGSKPASFIYRLIEA